MTERAAPAAEYTRRLQGCASRLDRLIRLEQWLGWGRLAVFGTGVGLAIVAFRGSLTPFVLLLPAAAFLVLAVRHDRVLRSLQTTTRAIAFYERGLARIRDRWTDGGETGERFIDDGHLYARDLDLFGRGSLFQLLSIARTRAGEQILAGWLTRAAPREEILARQEAVAELTPGLDLREAIAIAGTDVRGRVDPDALIEWAEQPVALTPYIMRYVVMATTLAALITLVLALRGDAPWVVFLIALAGQGLVAIPFRGRVEALLHAANEPSRELLVLSAVLSRLEHETFAAPKLQAIRRQLVDTGAAASSDIARLKTLVEMHDWQHNMFFAPLAAMVLWEVHLAWAIQSWRLATGRHVRGWLDAAGEFEALSSLAAYRYEHPDDPFPVIDDAQPATATPRPRLEGRNLGHPLIPADRVVRNDVSLTGDTRLYVISGSNMSGKSTYLRTVGINVVLALAGAPVRADALRLTPMEIGATLRIQDSLQEGRSRFYAEITRIREISDIAQRRQPLLFLLDELLHGTNSHDRLTGASGILRGLIDHGAIGLITTHDLALTAIADSLAPRALNTHFEDWFDGADIKFDYRMKPGPVTRSNAVALMRAVGLDVPVQ